MKTEFLQNLKVGDQPLPKEIIDAILAENGRDIENAKKPFADYDNIKEQLKAAKDGLKAFENVNVDELQGKIKTLQGDLAAKDAAWQQKLDDMTFDAAVKDAVAAAHGRNAKAIAALLDTDTLRKSKNREADLKTAVENVKKENAYLFESERHNFRGFTPPGGRDNDGHNGGEEVNTLHDAVLSAMKMKTNDPNDPGTT